jgi:hypothetical protein
MDTIKKAIAGDSGRKGTGVAKGDWVLLTGMLLSLSLLRRLVVDVGGDSIKVPLVSWEAISSTPSSTTDTKSNASSALNQARGISNPSILTKPITWTL